MITNGIRISDPREVKLKDILQALPNKSLYWTMLFLDGVASKGEGKTLLEFTKQVNQSKNGIEITYEKLLTLSDGFFQIYEIEIIGNIDSKHSHRYENENDMFKDCDIVILLIDCAFWEVYAKNTDAILNLKNKFSKSELIELGK